MKCSPQTKGATYQNSVFVCMEMSLWSICLTSEDLRGQTERRSRAHLGEFWRSLRERWGGVRSHRVGGGTEPRAQQGVASPQGKGPATAAPQGRDRQAEPHRVTVMVTAAGTAATHPPPLKKCQTFGCGGSGFVAAAGRARAALNELRP